MLRILFSAVIFCLVLKWVTLGLSAKIVAVAFYVVTVYVLTIYFFEKPGNSPKAEKVPVNNRNHPKR